MITERLLQFIWQFQYFNSNELTAVTGEKVQVIFPGQFNTNQGPDFTDGKIRIDDTTWAGTVELHIKTSDWSRHSHQVDSNYNNVILHVVWDNDCTVNQVPVIELKTRVSKILVQRYIELMNSSAFIPCEKSIGSVRDLTWKSWKERVLAERLLKKSQYVQTCLDQCGFHWEETFWWLLARNFGMKVNADAFEAIARSIPLNLLAKHKSQVIQLEALLFGQAGLLEQNLNKIAEENDYLTMLRKEYQYLQRKYKMVPVRMPIHFLRMRPGNFPTIRLAQLAMLISNSAHLFSRIKDADEVKDVRNWFDVTANDFWHYHYRFDEISAFKKKRLGETMIDNIFINTIIPVLFAYGNYHGEQRSKDKALKWLGEVSPEANSIITGFENLGIEIKTAYDSQALIGMKTEYCLRRRCLECAIGNAILRVG